MYKMSSRHVQSILALKKTLTMDYLRGLRHIHRLGIMHMDISPRNLVVKDFVVAKGIIIDFDSAEVARTFDGSGTGTLPYTAPEVVAMTKWRESPGDTDQPPSYSHSVDIWSLGISMFALCTQSIWSWQRYSEEQLKENEVSEQRWEKYHAKLRGRINFAGTRVELAMLLKVISLMVEYDPEDRGTAEELWLMLRKLHFTPGTDTIDPSGGGLKRKRDD